MSLRINSNFNLETNNKIFWEDYYMRSKIRSLNTNSMRKLDMSLYVKNLFVVFWLVFFLFGFSFTAAAADSSQVLNEVKNDIKNHYVDNIPDGVLNASSIDEALKKLNDPYTEYFSKEEETNFLNSINNKIYGIGIYMSQVPSGIKIDSVVANSPAENVGLKEGDIIISANSHSLANITFDQASSYIKGDENTNVNLVIQRQDKVLSFSVKRGEVSIPIVDGKMLDSGTAYIHIASFGEDTSQKFNEKLKELQVNKPARYIIDLRDNGGGYMDSALNVAGNFIGQNLALIVEDKNDKKTGYLAGEEQDIIDKPTIFLVDKYTASASEILSAAVKDYKKAFFIGNTTYGKGVAQQMFDLSDGGALKLTVEKFYSPAGNTIQKVGIKPDFDTGNENSLAAAQLLSGQCKNGTDKRGFLKATINNEKFYIDLSIAKNEGYWSAFKYIVSNIDRSQIWIGTKDGWAKVPEEYFSNIYKFFYPEDKVLDTMQQVSQNKAFTVIFNKKIGSDIKDKVNMEIINGTTGKRVAFKIGSVEDNKVVIVPQEKLEKGKTYYIKVKDTIKPVTVKN